MGSDDYSVRIPHHGIQLKLFLGQSAQGYTVLFSLKLQEGHKKYKESLYFSPDSLKDSNCDCSVAL